MPVNLTAPDPATLFPVAGVALGAFLQKLLPWLGRDLLPIQDVHTDISWLAAGRCDAYYERGVKEWDVAAGRIICQAAGLEVRELEPAGGLPAGVMACAPGLADELEALLA